MVIIHRREAKLDIRRVKAHYVPPAIPCQGVARAFRGANPKGWGEERLPSLAPRYRLVAEIRQLLLDSYYGRSYVEPYEKEDDDDLRRVVPLTRA